MSKNSTIAVLDLAIMRCLASPLNAQEARTDRSFICSQLAGNGQTFVQFVSFLCDFLKNSECNVFNFLQKLHEIRAQVPL